MIMITAGEYYISLENDRIVVEIVAINHKTNKLIFNEYYIGNSQEILGATISLNIGSASLEDTDEYKKITMEEYFQLMMEN